MAISDIVTFRRERDGNLRSVPAYQELNHKAVQRDRSYALNVDRQRKKDKISYLQIRRLDGSILFQTTRFLLQDVTEQRSEQFQIVETFGDAHILFYGKKPEIFQFSGVLPSNDLSASAPATYPSLDPTVSGIPLGPDFLPDGDWAANFIELYEREARGTRAASRGAYIRISYDDLIRDGYILSLDIRYSQATLGYVPCTFTLFIVKSTHVAPDSLSTVQALAALDEPPQDSQIPSNDQQTLPSINDGAGGFDPGSRINPPSAFSDDRIAAMDQRSYVPVVQNPDVPRDLG